MNRSCGHGIVKDQRERRARRGLLSSPHGLARHVICSQYTTPHMTHIVTPAAAADGATEKAADRAPAEQGMSTDVIARNVTRK
jgi:hypothetical protein